MKKDKRPIFLSVNPTKFEFPFIALGSILHRVTGVILFAGMGLLLWLADMAFESPAGFAQAVATLEEPWVKFGIWALFSTLLYHVLAGVRHLLLDFHIGTGLDLANQLTLFAIVATFLGSLAVANWL